MTGCSLCSSATVRTFALFSIRLPRIVIALLADTAGRNLAQPSSILAGVMAALIRTPYFVDLLLRK